MKPSTNVVFALVHGWVVQAGVHVVVGTPGRVYDMLRRHSLRPDSIKMFVLDEADEMLSRGFKDQVGARSRWCTAAVPQCCWLLQGATCVLPRSVCIAHWVARCDGEFVPGRRPGVNAMVVVPVVWGWRRADLRDFPAAAP